MHTIQYIATKANDAKDAHKTVQDYLENNLGGEFGSDVWYDWFVTGGGRWSTSDDPYDDNYTEDVVHQDNTKFQEYLDRAHKNRVATTRAELEHASKVNIDEVLNSIKENYTGLSPMYGEATKLYPFYCLYKQVSGYWGPDSYFFDIENDSTNSSYMQEAIKQGDKTWHLVPVDFHY